MFTVERPSEHVAVLRMDDGKVNAIGPSFVETLPQAWQEATEEDRAVVLAGNAKAFSAGLDLKVLPTLAPEELGAFMRSFLDAVASVVRHERPVVAAVDGPALAGGAILALSADVRLAGANARLGLTEVLVGVPFPPPVVELVRAKLPAHEHGPAVLDAATREGEAAVARGWAHRLVPSEALEEGAVARAERMAGHAGTAFGLAKRALNAELAAAFDTFQRDGLADYLEVLASKDVLGEVAEAFARVVKRSG